MCLICMKYRIIILIIIILSMGKISLSYIANTSRTHASMHARTRTHARSHARTRTPPHPHQRPSLFAVSVRPISPSRLGASLWTKQWPVGDPLKYTTCGRFCINDRFCFLSRIKQILGRTETRTRDRICFQTIRSV